MKNKNILAFALHGPYSSGFAGFLVYKTHSVVNQDFYLTGNPDYATKFLTKDEAMQAVKAWPENGKYDFMFFERI